MRIIQFGMLAIAAMLLAACTSTSREEYEAVQAALSGSPSYEAETVKECVEKVARKPLSTRRNAARIMNVSLSAMPTQLCKRLTGAWASGRLTYEDISKLDRRIATPRLIKVLQGRG